MRIVLDTNCLLISLPSTSKEHIIWENFLNNKISLCVSTEILEEYEEILQQKTSKEFADIIMRIIELRFDKNVICTDASFKYNFLKDMDDNKFVNCAIAANAQYIVTNDKHFNALDKIPFPKINRISSLLFAKKIRK